MIDTIEGCGQVKKCQKCQVAGIQYKEDVGHQFQWNGAHCISCQVVDHAEVLKCYVQLPVIQGSNAA